MKTFQLLSIGAFLLATAYAAPTNRPTIVGAAPTSSLAVPSDLPTNTYSTITMPMSTESTTPMIPSLPSYDQNENEQSNQDANLSTDQTTSDYQPMTTSPSQYTNYPETKTDTYTTMPFPTSSPKTPPTDDKKKDDNDKKDDVDDKNKQDKKPYEESKDEKGYPYKPSYPSKQYDDGSYDPAKYQYPYEKKYDDGSYDPEKYQYPYESHNPKESYTGKSVDDSSYPNKQYDDGSYDPEKYQYPYDRKYDDGSYDPAKYQYPYESHTGKSVEALNEKYEEEPIKYIYGPTKAYFFSKPGDRDQAAAYCNHYGGYFTGIGSVEENQFVGGLIADLGSRPVWVRSWQGDDYGGSCIALYPNGPIAIPRNECWQYYSALCAKY